MGTKFISLWRGNGDEVVEVVVFVGVRVLLHLALALVPRPQHPFTEAQGVCEGGCGTLRRCWALRRRAAGRLAVRYLSSFAGVWVSTNLLMCQLHLGLLLIGWQ